MDPRIGEIVGELDRVVPIDGARVVAFVDAFWQTYPAVAKHKHYTAILATPAGFLRFGIEFLKAALSPTIGKGVEGDLVPLELDYLLRQDSNLEPQCERVLRATTFRSRGSRAFDWGPIGDPARLGWLPLLQELDNLVSTANAEVIITVPQESLSVIPVRGTEAGFLRFGLEFAKGSITPASKRGRNRGDVVELDLDYLIEPDSEVEFHCERVEVLPERGDRRRTGEGIQGQFAIAVLITGVLAVLVRACLL